MKWYRKAAEHQYAGAQAGLGVMYENGWGVEQDYAEALKWYREAAEQGDACAQNNLGAMYRNGEGVEKDDAEAVKWWLKAAEQEHPNAQHNLGLMYYNGRGVEKDYSEAMKWWLKAAEQGNSVAQYNLGVMYDNGYGVEKNYAEAMKRFRKAAEQGNSSAQHNLGLMHYNGRGVEKDYAEAVKWWLKAAEQGQSDAQVSLVVMYADGNGVEKDYVEAYAWCNLAAKTNDKAAEARNILERQMAPQQVADAQKRIRELRASIEGRPQGPPADGPSFSNAQASELAPSATGPGFFITEDGYFVTGEHIVKDGGKVRLVAPDGLVSAKALSDASHAYGFHLGQTLSLDAIESKFPELAQQARFVRLQFESSFAASITNMDVVLSRGVGDWGKVKSGLRAKTAETLGRQPLTADSAKDFIETVTKRAKGDIPSPIVETLLAFHPSYISVPAREFLNGFTARYTSDGSGKAKGVRFQLDYPKSWLSADGNHPNIVRKFVSRNGRGSETIIVMIKPLPLPPGLKVTDREIEEMVAEIAISNELKMMLPDGATFIAGGPLRLDNRPGCYQRFMLKRQQLDMTFSSQVVLYTVYYKTTVIQIQCAVTSEANGGQSLQERFERLEPLFRLVANRFVIQSQWESANSSESSQSVSPEGAADSRQTGSGTGFAITDDGFIVTNEHVVKDAAQVRVRTGAGIVAATVVKVDHANDFALLKVNGRFTPLPVAASRAVRLGNTVATVGFPNIGLQGFAPKLTKGEISSLSGIQDDSRYFQISVPVQPGNSGGALVDERGNVVGVVAAKLGARAALAAGGALPENVNYAVKSSFLLVFLESLPEVAARLKKPNTRERKFEDVVKDVEQATALVLVD